MFSWNMPGGSFSVGFASCRFVRIAATELYERVPSASARAQAPSSRSAPYRFCRPGMPMQERNPCSGCGRERRKRRFHLDHVVLVGDRGMITQARITEDLRSTGLDWITALRAPAIKALLGSGALQLSLFDQRDMASITAPEFPGERL